jgi:hypothetical protein
MAQHVCGEVTKSFAHRLLELKCSACHGCHLLIVPNDVLVHPLIVPNVVWVG